MRLWWLSGGIVVMSMVISASAQEPSQSGPPATAAEMQRVLAEWQSLQVQLAHVGEALEKYRAAVAAELAGAEAQKKTLIEWLEQAQGKAQK